MVINDVFVIPEVSGRASMFLKMIKPTKQTILLYRLLLTILSIVVLSYSPASAEEFVEVTVAKGDYLVRIADAYLEDPAQWREIARINHLKNPDLIHPKQILLIPSRLLRGIPGDGVISWLQGNVSVQAGDGQEWLPLHLNDRIKEGSRIRTGDRSSVEIVFEDGTSCFQNAETLTGFLKMRRKGDSSEQRLFLERGRTITRILKATGREPRFEIETPSAVCAARGTIFRTSVDSFGTARYEVLEGQAKVEAMRQKTIVSEGEGTIVRRGSPPEKPRKLLSPPKVKLDDTHLRKLPFRLRFEPGEGAVSCRIWVTSDREGRDTLFENLVSSSEAVEIRDLDDGTYFLHAVSIDEIGLEGLPAGPEELRIRVNPLPPFITMPVKDAEYRGKTVQFAWLSVQDAVSYQIQIARDAAFQQIIDEANCVSGTVSITRELDYGSYYFRIRSVAKDGYEGAWSDPIEFAVVAPPASPALETPEVAEKEIHIRWQDLGKGMSYHFQMSRDADFSTVFFDKRLGKPEIVIQKPGDLGKYYIRVSSVDSRGYEGTFSNPQIIIIKEGSLALFFGVAATLGLIFALFP